MIKTDKFTQKWAVAAFFDPLREGFEFHRSETPLHITLALVFASKKRGKEISKLLQDAIDEPKEFYIAGSHDENWGTIKVTRLEESPELRSLYMLIQQMLIDDGAIFDEPEYLLENFKTHSTHQKSGSLHPGEKVLIHSLSLVDMFPNSNAEQRRIFKNFKLGKNE